MRKKLTLAILTALLAILIIPTTANAQGVRIWKGGISLTIYTNDVDSIVFFDKNDSTPSTPATDRFNGHEYVDLGLSSGTLWATQNIGASTATEVGDYFAWGETEPKTEFSWNNYKWGTSENNLTKYNQQTNRGFVDNISELKADDDAAHVNWGGDWRIPTVAEGRELIDSCTWEWIADDKAMKVTGPNGNYIMIPFGGLYWDSDLSDGFEYVGEEGDYWLNSLFASNSSHANSICIYDASHQYIYQAYSRENGMNIRPVCSKTK